MVFRKKHSGLAPTPIVALFFTVSSHSYCAKISVKKRGVAGYSMEKQSNARIGVGACFFLQEF